MIRISLKACADFMRRQDIVALPSFADVVYKRDSIDYNFLAAGIVAIVHGHFSRLFPSPSSSTFDPEGAILVFMPGVLEIRKLQVGLADDILITSMLNQFVIGL